MTTLTNNVESRELVPLKKELALTIIKMLKHFRPETFRNIY